jgi:Family of unknown function (DUF5999)
MTSIKYISMARQTRQQRCPHVPQCPGCLAHDRTGARTIACHPEQGWSLLCNGVVVFDDGGELLPDGRAIPSPSPLPAAADSLPAAA